MHALNKLLLFHALTCLGRIARGDEIINGEEALKNSMQYMASIQNNGLHECGGFLISEDFVVTAAHCGCSERTRVVLGTHNLKRVDDDKIRYIERIYRHPDYHGVGFGKDIMLLKLSKKVHPDNSVQTIPLPSSDMNIRENEKCHVAGWGFTRSHGQTVDELRVVDVSVINLQVCKERWPGLPGNVICAGGYETAKGFCQGDSGGPLVCNGRAVGIVSFNYNMTCDYPDNHPNIYTDVSKYLDWINSITKGIKHFD
ncbi:trypsin-3-like [Symphorus nematophorus]